MPKKKSKREEIRKNIISQFNDEQKALLKYLDENMPSAEERVNIAQGYELCMTDRRLLHIINTESPKDLINIKDLVNEETKQVYSKYANILSNYLRIHRIYFTSFKFHEEASIVVVKQKRSLSMYAKQKNNYKLISIRNIIAYMKANPKYKL